MTKLVYKCLLSPNLCTLLFAVHERRLDRQAQRSLLCSTYAVVWKRRLDRQSQRSFPFLYCIPYIYLLPGEVFWSAHSLGESMQTERQLITFVLCRHSCRLCVCIALLAGVETWVAGKANRLPLRPLYHQLRFIPIHRSQ